MIIYMTVDFNLIAIILGRIFQTFSSWIKSCFGKWCILCSSCFGCDTFHWNPMFIVWGLHYWIWFEPLESNNLFTKYIYQLERNTICIKISYSDYVWLWWFTFGNGNTRYCWIYALAGLPVLLQLYQTSHHFN